MKMKTKTKMIIEVAVKTPQALFRKMPPVRGEWKIKINQKIKRKRTSPTKIIMINSNNQFCLPAGNKNPPISGDF